MHEDPHEVVQYLDCVGGKVCSYGVIYRVVVAYLLADDLLQVNLLHRKAPHPHQHYVADIVRSGVV